jgi:hypothetical protein
VKGFQAALALTNADELETVLLMSAANSNDWLARKRMIWLRSQRRRSLAISLGWEIAVLGI